jgi:hypothetical protein
MKPDARDDRNVITRTVIKHLNELYKHPSTAAEKIHGTKPQLLIGDLVFIQNKNFSIKRAILRKITGSKWDHVGIVIHPLDVHRGIMHDLLAESFSLDVSLTTLRGGIQIQNLRKYLEKPTNYEVAIGRFPFLNQKERDKIRYLAFSNLDAPAYQQPLLNYLLAYFFEFYREIFLNSQRFSCSGVVQRVMYEAASSAEQKNRVLFRPGICATEALDLVTPADIAEHPEIEWLWPSK